ncbi:MAG: gliding motility-associated C-terminal domain-containing protein [Saprospiraceae bacterium]
MIYSRLLILCGLALCSARMEARVQNAADTLPCALQLNLGPDIWICSNAVFSLNPGAAALPGITYAWSGSPGLSCTDCPSPTVSALGAGVYMYALSMSDTACAVSDTVVVTVLSGQQPLYILIPDTAICLGQSVGLGGAAMPGSQYEWLDEYGMSLGHQPNPVVQPVATTLYYVIVKNNVCPLQFKDSVLVSVFAPPVASVNGDMAVCMGGLVRLSDAAPEPQTLYTWSPDTGLLTPWDELNGILQVSVSGWYALEARNPGCIWRDSLYILALDTTVQISPDTVICPGGSASLRVEPSDEIESIVWSPALGLSCSDCPNPVATPAASTLYVVSGSRNGCPFVDSVRVDIAPPLVVTLPPNLSICLNDTVSLNPNAPIPGATYLWTSSDPSFAPTNAPNPSAWPRQAASYTLKVSDACSMTEVQTFVSVQSAILIVRSDTTICQNQAAKLSASSSLPGAFVWSTGESGQAIVVSPSVTTDYWVVYTYGNGCVLRDTVRVTVDGVAQEVAFPEDLSLCPGESLMLNTLPPMPGATYSWTSLPPGFTSNLPNPVVSPLTPTTYFVTTQLDNCTLSKQVVVVTLSPNLSVTPDTTLCRGDAIRLTATAGLTGEYVWLPGGQSGPVIEVSPDQHTTYTAQFYFGDGCIAEAQTVVTVVPGFSLSIQSDPPGDTLDLGQALTLTAGIAPSANLNQFKFTWTDESGKVIGSDQTLALSALDDDDGFVRISVSVVAPSGCRQTATRFFVLVQPKVSFPNAFTPDGDGVNDSFGPVTLQGRIAVERMQVFNRWGQKVYESEDPQSRWNGLVDGKPAPSDLYFYLVRWVRGDGALQIAKGEVLLLR